MNNPPRLPVARPGDAATRMTFGVVAGHEALVGALAVPLPQSSADVAPVPAATHAACRDSVAVGSAPRKESAAWLMRRTSIPSPFLLLAGVAAACAVTAPPPTAPSQPGQTIAGAWQLDLTASWSTFETREVVRTGSLRGSATLSLDPTGEATLCTDATLHDGRSASAYAPGGASEHERVQIQRVGGLGEWSSGGVVRFVAPAPCGSTSAAGLELRCALDGDRLVCRVVQNDGAEGLGGGPPLLALTDTNAPWALPREAMAGSKSLWFTPLRAGRALVLKQRDPWKWTFDIVWTDAP